MHHQLAKNVQWLSASLQSVKCYRGSYLVQLVPDHNTPPPPTPNNGGCWVGFCFVLFPPYVLAQLPMKIITPEYMEKFVFFVNRNTFVFFVNQLL